MLDQGKSFSTMSDLAKKLKISLRTLYEIAPSKEELIVTTVDRVLKKHGKIAMDAMNTHSSPIKKLESFLTCLLYTSPSPRDRTRSRMPSSA